MGLQYVPVPTHIYRRHLHQKGFNTFLKNFELKNGTVRGNYAFVERSHALSLNTVKKRRLVLIEVNFRHGYKGLKIIDQNAYFNVSWQPFRYVSAAQGSTP